MYKTEKTPCWHFYDLEIHATPKKFKHIGDTYQNTSTTNNLVPFFSGNNIYPRTKIGEQFANGY